MMLQSQIKFDDCVLFVLPKKKCRLHPGKSYSSWKMQKEKARLRYLASTSQLMSRRQGTAGGLKKPQYEEKAFNIIKPWNLQKKWL